mgnify:CR=1 FL=1
MTKISFDYTKAAKFISEEEINALSPYIKEAHNTLHNKTGRGSDFTGWVNLPENYDREEYDRIKKAAEKIKSNSKALIVIGIGGSYLGARMACEMLHHNFSALNKDKKGVDIFFAGNNISSTYLADLVEIVKDIDFSINIISKNLIFVNSYKYFELKEICVLQSFESLNVTIINVRSLFSTMLTRVLPAFFVYPVFPPIKNLFIKSNLCLCLK